jgi:hypothetical protein
VDTSQRTVSDFFQEQFTSKLLNGVNCALILGGAKSSGKSHSLFGEIPAKHCPVLSQIIISLGSSYIMQGDLLLLEKQSHLIPHGIIIFTTMMVWCCVVSLASI